MTTLYVPYRAAEMETLLTHSGARAFIGLEEVGDFRPAQTALELRDRIPTLEHVIVLGDASDGACSFADLARAAPHDLSDGPVAADPFLLLYTSGTSAGPKGVPLAYQGILGNARLGVPEHGITNADRILSAAPFGHLYALYSFHLALACGASTVLLPAFTPPDLARTLESEAVTVLFAAPAHVAACLGAGLLDARAMSRLRLAVLSGSAVAPSVATGLQERMANGRVTQLWGMTETQAGLYTRPGDPIETVASSAGRPSPGTEARVVGPDDTTLSAGEEGELHVRGPLLFAGYFNHPGRQPRRVFPRRLVPHRRPCRLRCAGERRHHGTLQGRHQPGRRQVQPPRHRGPARRTILRSTWRRSCRCRTLYWASAPAAASPSRAARRRPSRPSALTWRRAASRSRDGRNVWKFSTRCR